MKPRKPRARRVSRAAIERWQAELDEWRWPKEWRQSVFDMPTETGRRAFINGAYQALDAIIDAILAPPKRARRKR